MLQRSLAERCPQSPGDFTRREELELAVGAECADAERGSCGFDFVRRRHRQLRPERGAARQQHDCAHGCES